MSKFKKSFCAATILMMIAALLILAGVFLLTPRAAHAEDAHDHGAMTALSDIADGELTEGKYYLTGDISGNIIVKGDVTLCLNGHSVTGDRTDSVIIVHGDATFTLCDCQETGCITGGNAENGGGVYVVGTFIMNGGKISGNHATKGGGVYSKNGTIIMTGGTISNNTATNGGGVMIEQQSIPMPFTFSLSKKQAPKTVDSDYPSAFTMTGGKISENTATGEGGGVCIDASSWFKVSGAPNITGNKDADGSNNNVYAAIHVTDTLTADAQIGINDTSKAITGFTQDGDPADYFIPDISTYNCVYVSDGTVSIGTHTGGTATCSEKAQCDNCGTGYGELDSSNHDYATEFTVDTEATCTTAGSESKHCTRCDSTTDVTEIPARGHAALTHHEETAATEDADGNIEYWTCDECNTYFSDADGTEEITDKASVIIPKLTAEQPPETNEPSGDKSGLWIVLGEALGVLIIIGVVTAIVFVSNKKTHKTKVTEKAKND